MRKRLGFSILTSSSRRGGHIKLGVLVVLITLLTITIQPAFCEEEEDINNVDFDDDDGVVEDAYQDDGTAASDADLEYESPSYDPSQFHFVDHFDDVDESKRRWIKSQAKKDDISEEIAKYDGVWEWEAPMRIVSKKDVGLVLKSKAKHHAIAARLDKVFTFKEEKPLVVQYEVTMQEGQECGGSYIKLLSHGKQTEDLTKFNDKTPYTIMFGPDKCGNDIKMHFIFRHVNPINGSISEKHCRKPKDRLEEPFKDKLPHLYQLIVRPDNTFEISVDNKIINEGSLLNEFTPPVNPPRDIDDPEDKKPADWDEREKIPDPLAHKPVDWDDDAPPQIPDPSAEKPDGWLDDEPEMIPDPTAVKPEDWDSEIDGDWEAPLVDNPICEKVAGCGRWKAPLIPNKEFKGKWRAPMIDNPNYQGKWAARKIPNPDYYEDLAPFKMTPISAVGLELWSMSSDILFDNLVITDDIDVAKDFAAKTFELKRKHIDRESKTLWHRIMRYINYKPGWWALYFLYLSIPAGCYIYYLYGRAKEENKESFFSKITAFFRNNPWAWRIGIVLVFAPVAFSVYRLFSKGGASINNNAQDANDAKKTDAVQEDDVSSTEGPADSAAHNKNDIPKTSPKQKKSDLDVDENTMQPPSYDAANDAENNENADVADDEKELFSSKEDNTQASNTRKRRVRKDQS